ncbi:hypothetical protein QN277_023766 [Acacia crassicarpa]|uniref:WRKY domain-containing protein n=1 Tax=Acacia crassicarpa TaxID=499986 RepID=A0AAE1MNC1_9FABA|nr:hypothetical protein QN277_023766 [Acacia crassicarpa]
MADDWDLHAVVRGCTTVSSSSITTSTSAVTTTSSASSSVFSLPLFFGTEKVSQVLSLSDLDPIEAKPSSSIEELHELCKPFFPKSSTVPPSSSSSLVSPLSPSSSFSYNSPTKPVQTQHKQQNLQPKNKLSHAGPVSTTPRSKRRKNQLKKVCQVPAESLSSDIWAWRKYGQKPIKGSPYPRGYYRCSSSKGCLARKQVERNRSDPSMFIVTYTAEHNHPAPTHRNSLAGSTRQKPSTPTTAAVGAETEKTLTKAGSPATSGVEEEEAAPQSTDFESKVEMEDLMEEDEDDDLGLSDSVLTDDFFEGLDELTGPSPPSSSEAPVTADCFVDPFSTGFSLPSWPAANAAATTAGGNC